MIKFRKAQYINLVIIFTSAWHRIRDQKLVLGFLWSFLNPLIMSAIMFFLFKSRMGRAPQDHYFLYILIGVISWNFLSIAVQTGQAALLVRANMVRNVVFPKEILVYGQIGVYAIQHIYEWAVVFFFLGISGVGFSRHIILLPAVMLMQCLLIAALALVLSCICVYARDTVHIWTVFTQMGIFLTPIFYKTSSLSKEFRWIVELNPMTQIINFLRDILLYHRYPDWLTFSCIAAFSLAAFALGYKIFKFFEPKIVERV